MESRWQCPLKVSAPELILELLACNPFGGSLKVRTCIFHVKLKHENCKPFARNWPKQIFEKAWANLCGCSLSSAGSVCKWCSLMHCFCACQVPTPFIGDNPHFRMVCIARSNFENSDIPHFRMVCIARSNFDNSKTYYRNNYNPWKYNVIEGQS